MEAAYVTWVRRYVWLWLGLGGAFFFFFFIFICEPGREENEWQKKKEKLLHQRSSRTTSRWLVFPFDLCYFLNRRVFWCDISPYDQLLNDLRLPARKRVRLGWVIMGLKHT